MAPGKISQARCPRQGVLGQICPALAKTMQHWRKICSIGETYAALAKHMRHWRKLCKLLCCLTCVLQQVVKTGAKWVKPSPSTAPAQKKYSGTIKVETGTGQRRRVEPGIETSLEPLKMAGSAGSNW